MGIDAGTANHWCRGPSAQPHRSRGALAPLLDTGALLGAEDGGRGVVMDQGRGRGGGVRGRGGLVVW